jgi:hypothetical protein
MLSVNVRYLALLVTPLLVLVGCHSEHGRSMGAPSTPVASSVGATMRTASEVASCPEGSPQSGDIDGDGRPDAVTLEPGKGIIRVRLAAGPVHEVTVHSLCPSLLGFADVNGDGRDELWWKDGLGNTAHVFNLVAWVQDRLVVVVGPDTENPLFIGWGFSGGATLWCADANGDGRTDLIRQDFSRNSHGQIESEREIVYDLHGATLVRISEGPARTPLPGDSAESLTCGAVRWR